MGLARARVELKNYNPNADREERMRDLKNLLTGLRKACGIEGIKREFTKHQTYEKPGEKRRRKKRQAEAARLKGNVPSEKKKEYE